MVRIPGVNVHGRVEPEPSDDTQKKNRKDDAPNSQRTELAGNGRTHEVGGRADPEDDNRGKTNINRGQADAQQFGSVADTSQSNGDIGKEQRNAVGVVGQKISGFAEGILGVAAHARSFAEHSAFGESIGKTQGAEGGDHPRENRDGPDFG